MTETTTVKLPTPEDLAWAESQCAGQKLLPREESERTHETHLMTDGKLYAPAAPELAEARAACRELLYAYNLTRPSETGRRRALLRTLFDRCAEDPFIEPPLRMDYGRNTRFGRNCQMNFNCVILDVARVTVGDNFLAAPGVGLFTATHPTDPALRCWSGRELGFAITIGDNVWLGAHTVVCPGVRIGDNVVAGAGTVIVHDVPANSVIVGNPARIVNTVTPPPAVIAYDYLGYPQPLDYDKDGRVIPAAPRTAAPQVVDDKKDKNEAEKAK